LKRKNQAVFGLPPNLYPTFALMEFPIANLYGKILKHHASL